MTEREDASTASGARAPRRPSWRDVLSIDLRALAALRVGLGAVLIADLAIRARDLRAHYSDLGILPRDLLAQIDPNVAYGSLHFLFSGSPDALVALFVLHGVCALALLLGWRTRLATVLCWLLLISLHKRNPLINHGGDQLLAMMLFWGMFLPLGARFSLDARRAREAVRGRVLSVAGAALLVQVVLVYWMALLLRTTPVWWEGNAVYYVLHLDFLVKEPALLLRGLPWLHAPLNYATLLVEAVGPLLCFVPRWHRWWRPAAFVLFAGMHLSFALVMTLGTFAWISILSWVPFLPPWVWDRLGAPKSGLREAGGWIRSRRPVDACAAVLLVFVLAMNLKQPGVPFETGFVPDRLEALGKQLRIHQPWRMFTPNPAKLDGWYLFEGRTAGGERVDLLTGRASRGSLKPRLVNDTFPSYRWQIFLFWLRAPKHYEYVRPLGRYLCREGRWPEDARGAPGRSVDVWFFAERTPPPGEAVPEPQRVHVLEMRCRGKRGAEGPAGSGAGPRPGEASAP